MLKTMPHEFIEAVAAGILAGGGGFVVLMTWRASVQPRTVRAATMAGGGSAAISPTTTSLSFEGALVLTTLAASLGAALIHLAVAPEHLDELGAWGWAFIVAAFLQSAVAVAMLARPTRAIAIATVVLNIGMIAAWAWSRIVGLPFGPDAWVPEAIGRADALCIALEGIALVAMLGWLRLAGRRPISIATSVPSITIVPLIGIVVVLTILALAGPGGEHGHMAAAAGRW